jgi:hypothetical protein
MSIWMWVTFWVVSLLILLGVHFHDQDKKKRATRKKSEKERTARELSQLIKTEGYRKCIKHKRTNMKKKKADGIWIDVCPKCGGTWLDGRELKRLKRAAYNDGHSSGHSSGSTSGSTSGLATGLIIGSMLD